MAFESILSKDLGTLPGPLAPTLHACPMSVIDLLHMCYSTSLCPTRPPLWAATTRTHRCQTNLKSSAIKRNAFYKVKNAEMRQPHYSNALMFKWWRRADKTAAISSCENLNLACLALMRKTLA